MANSAKLSPAGPAAAQTPPLRRYRRLNLWAVGRSVLVLGVLGLALIIWFSSSQESATFRTLTATATATATVVNSRLIAEGDGPGPPPEQLQATVVFAVPGQRRPVTATVEPYELTSVQPGERLPVRYDPAEPSRAAYAGPGGDASLNGTGWEFAFVPLLLGAAAALLLTGALRFARIRGTVRRGKEREVVAANTTVRVRQGSSSKYQTIPRIRVRDPQGGPDLEWRVLSGQPQVPETALVSGQLSAGRWLTAHMPDSGLIWPACRAQPVIGTGIPLVPGADRADLDVVAAGRRLLAAYVHVLRQADALPLMTRRPPGTKATASWWALGAPRPVVRWLLAAHLRSRLRELGRALTRTALLTETDDGGLLRGGLHEGSRECEALTATLPRRAWFGVAVAVATTGLTIYATFFQVPHVHLNTPSIIKLVVTGLAIAFILVVAPVHMFFKSVQCKRALLSPVLAGRKISAPGAAENPAAWDVYRFERDAFRQAGAACPREWEASPWLGRLIVVLYVLAVGVPLLLRLGALADLVHAL
jgi:hypothetical protein